MGCPTDLSCGKASHAEQTLSSSLMWKHQELPRKEREVGFALLKLLIIGNLVSSLSRHPFLPKTYQIKFLESYCNPYIWIYRYANIWIC